MKVEDGDEYMGWWVMSEVKKHGRGVICVEQAGCLGFSVIDWLCLLSCSCVFLD